ncbi:MAG: type IX secretion system membrane protein PorP/SprF [Gelidibacter sp.]
MKNFYITLVFIATSFAGAVAQQDAQYTQYMYNTQVVNPAYAGSRGVFSIAALYRSQWIGLDGAPTTQTLNINSPVSKRLGIGMSIVNNEIGNGTNQNTYFSLDYAYTIPTSSTGKLSLGLKAGGHLLDVNLAKLRNYNPGLHASDDIGVDKKFSPNFGAGIYYHTDRFYTGLSVPNFLQTTHFETAEGSNSYQMKESMEYYLISGFVTDINYNLKLKPAVLIKAVSGAPLQVDLSATLLYNEKFSLGAAYRWDAAVSALFGFQINEKMMLGMAYDRETTELGGTQYNDGSLEVFLRFELISHYGRVLTPRFF